MIFKKVDTNWEVKETTRLFGLTLTETGRITAPEGKQVTLIYNGENLPIAPGAYEGDVVLEVTDNLPIQGSNFRAAVVIENSRYAPEKSVTAAAIGGSVSNDKVSGVSVTSYEEAVNGIYCSVSEGKSVTIEDVDLNMRGNGGNDFIGYGAAIAAAGKGKLTVNSSKIHTSGAARGSIYAGENVELTVNDSEIVSRGGVLNADYKDTIKTTLPDVMRRVPWMLGLRGNCRATNLLDYANATYNRCTMKSDGWGVLSTDGVKKCRLFVNDSDIEITGQSGYGALSIGDCVDSFSGCRFKVPSYALIMLMGKSGGQFLNGTEVDSGRFAVMCSGSNGRLDVKDSTLKSGETTFMVKGCGSSIYCENSALQTGNGIILQVMDSDDPGNAEGFYCDPEGPDELNPERDLTATKEGTDVVAVFTDMKLTGDMFNGTTNLKGETGGANLLMGGGAPGGAPGGFPPMGGDMPAMPGGGMPPMGGGAPGGAPGGFPPMGGDMPAMPGGGFPPMGGGAPGGGMPDMPADFDFGAMFGGGGEQVKNLGVTLKNSTLTGKITAAISHHRVSKVSKENCEELGEVTNTAAPAVNNGVIVELNGDSVWTVTGKCYLTALTIEAGSRLKSANGEIKEITVDGKAMELKPGTYKGAIVIE